MESLDIVHLIEKNPITKLSNVFNNKLLMKIKENFTDLEQKLFVSSFYCYLNYNQTTDFVIDLDNVWKWVGFQQKVKAKSLLERNFKPNIDYKIMLSHNVKQSNGRGGHNKETIMLTITTFKKFCIRAETSKAEQIHNYFIKLEEITYLVIDEENKEMRKQLESNNVNSNLNSQKQREQILLTEFKANRAIVYIIKVKSFENGEYIIKIGESREGIHNRYTEDKSNYDEVLLLDCFSVKKSKKFEEFLHSHKDIKFNRVIDLNGHETERELFLVGKDLTYKQLMHIIDKNIKYFNEYTEENYEKLEMEIEMLKQKNDLLRMNNQSEQPAVCNMNDRVLNELFKKIENLEKSNQKLEKTNEIIEKTNKEILEKLKSMQSKTTTNFNQPLSTLGPRLQKINPETLMLVKVYESVTECLKEYNYTVKRPSITKAVAENTIYQGFRWAFVDRELDPNIISNLEPTKPTRLQNIGYIAKLNKEKTEIINVYLDRKVASKENGYISSSALDNHVKKHTLTNGFFYILYNDCNDEIKTKFVNEKNKGKMPLLYKDGIGQYDEENNLIKDFVCKYDCIKQLNMSEKTLTKALDKKITYNNCYFKRVGIKIKCL